MGNAEEEFYSTYGNEYGYGGRINDIRDQEFPNLQGKSECYLHFYFT